MQFHPTTLAPTGVLITEGCRGEGAYLLNADGERFLERYAPNAMELASRDVISRAEQTEIDEGRGVDGNVLLDLRHLGAEKIIERLHGTRELAHDVRGRRPDLRADPRSPGCPLPHGRRRHRRLGAHVARGPVLRRRGRVRVGARREPPRRQRADGDDHVRQALGPARGRVGALEHDGHGAPRRRQRRRARAARAARPHDRASGRGRSATSSRGRCTRTSASSGARTRCGARARSSTASASATAASSSRTRATLFNSDLTQALELGFLLELAQCMVVCGIARKESRGAHARPHDYPERDDENFMKHTHVTVAWTVGPRARLEAGDDDEWQPAGDGRTD